MKKYVVILIFILVFFIVFSMNVVCETPSGVFKVSADTIKPIVIFNYGDTILIGTDQGRGIIKFHKQTEQFEFCLPQSGQFPSEGTISTIEVDASGNIWFLIRSLGMGYYDGEDYTVYTAENSPLPLNKCDDIEIDENNTIYVIRSVLLTIIKENAWETIDLRDSPMDFVFKIRDIKCDASGTLWIGGDYLGSSIPADYWSLAKFTDSQLIPVNSDYHIDSLLFDEEGVLWLGTWYDGLVRYDGSEFYSYNTDNSNIPSMNALDLNLDSNGNIWFIGYGNTLVCFDRTDFTNYLLPDYFPEDIDHISSIYSLAVDEENVVWISFCGWNKNQWGTYFYKSGLLRFDGNTWTFFYIPEPPPVHVEEEKQGEFRLWQNYPNPFNLTTSISYEITKTETVKISIFNISGQEIAVLENKVKKPGIYSVTWNARGFASGTYICKIETDSQVISRSMTLVK